MINIYILITIIQISISFNYCTIMDYSRKGNIDEIITYMEDNNDINRKASRGEMNLSRACERGCYKIVLCVIQNGADPSIFTNYRDCAVDIARNMFYTEIENYLIEQDQ